MVRLPRVDVVAAIPYTAWEQAVFVVLLILLVIVLLGWVSRENKTSREFQRAEALRRDAATSELSKSWQSFLSDRAKREDEANSETRILLTAQTQAISTLTQSLAEFRKDFELHDAREWARMDQIEQYTKERHPLRRSTDTDGK